MISIISIQWKRYVLRIWVHRAVLKKLNRNYVKPSVFINNVFINQPCHACYRNNNTFLVTTIGIFKEKNKVTGYYN